MRSFDYLASKMSKEAFEDKIVKPLLQQLLTDNWRIKCQIIEVLKTFINTPTLLTEAMLKTVFALTDDKIDAVRVKTNELIIAMVNGSSKEWSDQHLMPRLSQMKENANYIKKQNLLDIIEVRLHLSRKPQPMSQRRPSRMSTRTQCSPASQTKSPTLGSSPCKC